MDVFEVIKARRSIRKYRNQRIPDDALDRILESARFAPSAGSRYPWFLVVVRKDETKKALAIACNNVNYISECDVFIAAAGDPSQQWYVTDTSVAIEHMVLTAWEMGIGSCWVGNYNEDLIKTLLSIPQDKRLVACLTLGYANESPSPRPRKDMSDLVYREKYTPTPSPQNF
mgnify:CR=1 FL=1